MIDCTYSRKTMKVLRREVLTISGSQINIQMSMACTENITLVDSLYYEDYSHPHTKDMACSADIVC